MTPTSDEFAKLALDQTDTLYRVARRLVRGQEQAADLVQETYLRAFRARSGFDLKEHGIRPWLLRIMHNLHVSRATREKKQPLSMDGAILDASDTASPAVPHSPFSTLRPDDLDERLVAALDQLPGDYQIVLLLWAVEELSYKEIADVLEIPMGTVMSRLHRARQKLSSQLHDYALKEGVIRE